MQVRTARSQLAIFEAEVRSLTGNQASAEMEWKDKTSRLECDLNQVTTQKVYENRIFVHMSSLFHLD